jgi:hypothetical protein
MFRIASDMLNSIDNVAKESLEGKTHCYVYMTIFTISKEPKESAKSIRMKRKETASTDSLPIDEDGEVGHCVSCD